MREKSGSWRQRCNGDGCTAISTRDGKLRALEALGQFK